MVGHGLAESDPTQWAAFGHWAGRWLQTESSRLNPEAAARLTSVVNRRILPTFESSPMEQIDPSNVRAWVNGLYLYDVPRTARTQAIKVMKRMLRDAAHDGVIYANPFDYIDTRPPWSRRGRAVRHDQRVHPTVIRLSAEHGDENASLEGDRIRARLDRLCQPPQTPQVMPPTRSHSI